jgi:hypothetical protein
MTGREDSPDSELGDTLPGSEGANGTRTLADVVLAGMSVCPRCGREIRQEWKHCIFCGATMRGCSRCGAPLQHVPGEAFCHECGAPLRTPPDAPTVPLDPERPPEMGDGGE